MSCGEEIMSYKTDILNLEKKYSETNVSQGEALSNETKKRINQNYNRNQQKRRVDAILNNVKNKDSLKEEVHDIIRTVNLKELCKNCKEEVIIAVIILYVQKSRNSEFRVNRTRLWREYDLTWLKYSLILERLLQQTRESKPIRTNKKVDNEQLIYW